LLIGFDNREISTVCRPQLSTVALPLFEIGQKAAHIMLDILSGKGMPAEHEIMLECSIIERESTLGARVNA
jgi:LacI family transcriptional regulator